MNSDSRTIAGDAFGHHQGDPGGPVPLTPSKPLVEISADYVVPLALIRLVVLAIAPFILVDAAMYQLQMLVTGGSTPITAAVLKLALMAVFAGAFILRGKISHPAVVKIAFLFVAYLVLDALHQYFNLGLDFIDILLSYNAYYLLPLIGVIALSTPVKISDRLLVTISLVLSVICGATRPCPILNKWSDCTYLEQ